MKADPDYCGGVVGSRAPNFDKAIVNSRLQPSAQLIQGVCSSVTVMHIWASYQFAATWDLSVGGEGTDSTNQISFHL